MTSQLVRKRSIQLRQERQRGLLAITAAVLLIAVLAFWRFPMNVSNWYDAGLIAVSAWAISSVFVLRKKIWPPPPPPDVFSANGVDFYRAELLEARSHLRATWMWAAPAFLALGLFTVRMAAQAQGRGIPIKNLAPFLALSIIWAVAFAIKMRSRLQALDAEIRELDALRD